MIAGHSKFKFILNKEKINLENRGTNKYGEDAPYFFEISMYIEKGVEK